MEQLKLMKERLVDCVEKQIDGNLEYANAEELGEAVDMIKDLSEAIYYCTITEAMNEKEQVGKGTHYPAAHYYGGNYLPEPAVTPAIAPAATPAYVEPEIMYASGDQGGSRNYTPMYASRGGRGGGSRNYTPMLYASDGGSQSGGGSRNYTPMYASDGGATSYMYYSPEYGYPMTNPEHEGRSHMVRRRYMDGKKQNDKQTQIKELEQYTQELASDLTEMIKDASPEEKQLLQQKISLLASKIK